MKRNVTLSAIALVFSAGLASAAEINPGVAQLAAQLGVSASEYTVVELNQLAAAKRDGDQSTVDFLLSHFNRAAEGAASVNPGKAQFAAQLGVDASQYTGAELQQILNARRDGDLQAEAFVRSHTNRQTYDIAPQPARGRDA
ncbi:hypothetical protein [Rhodobacter xanthinilyticus]|nr:hypothetical protein [Rhodobacter xanthinilyticus]